MPTDFRRVAIVNRGEPAMRFIRAAREFSYERGVPLRTIALYTEPDRDAMFVREADEAFSLGLPQFVDRETLRTKSSYLDYKRLEQAMAATLADAAWVGWGFVAEHAAFADLCREMGIVFIGPSGDVMRQLGDKIAAKRLAEQAHIAVAPWSDGPVESVAEALSQAERMGFPLLIKATAGGGGHGIRLVHTASQLPQAFDRARAEAFKAFGDPTVFLEHLVEGARHVEVQVIADQYGTTWAAGVRDCSIQRRHQKVLEEAPSPALSLEQDQELCAAAVRISKAAGYCNAGTVEFLYEPQARQFFFMEVNTRLQVEHPVTECTTGIDLVKLQIHVALGGRLEGEPPRTKGHAVEVRLNAEDTDNGFAAAPGVLERFRVGTGPGVRLETGVAEGDAISAEFDSMIAKVIGYGQTRKEALSRLQRALRESVIVVKGGASNKSFLVDLLGRKEVKEGAVDVGWLDRIAVENGHLCRKYADAALVQAAINAYDSELAVEQAQFYASAARGRPFVRSEIGRVLALRHRGRLYSMQTNRLGPKDYRIESDGVRIEAHIDRLDEFECWLKVFGRRFHVVSVSQGLTSRIEVDGVSHQVDRDDGGVVHAPAPSVVVSVAVKVGDTVEVGDRLAVLEAMKMETQIVAPFAGKVRKIMTMPNVQVDAGAPLVQIEGAAGAEENAAHPRVVLGESYTWRDAREATCVDTLKELRQVMLGFDVDPALSARHLAAWSQTCPAQSDDITQHEDEILTIFVNVCSLFHREPEVNHRASGEEPSAESYLFSYLRMVETGVEGLPLSFVAALRGALAHYGVHELDGSVELKQTLLWVCKSHQRMAGQVTAVLDILERRLHQAKAAGAAPSASFRTLLDCMMAMTHELYPAVSDLAREVRYRYFDLPLLERARDQVLAEAESNLTYLQEHPDAPDRRVRLHALIECPQLLAGLFGAHFPSADSALRCTMLEVLTWRYYRNCALREPRSSSVDGHPCFSAQYDSEGTRTHIFAAYAEYSNLSAAARSLIPAIEQVPSDHETVLDLHVDHPAKLDDPDQTQQLVEAMLREVSFFRPVRRIVVSVAGPSHGARGTVLQHFTYQHNGTAYEEDPFYRGLHPLMGKRLHLWRLGNFKIDRVPSVEDVYVLHAVARDNPKDERLFAAAEVRDVSPVRDDAGNIVQLPHLERMLMEALAAIRLFQSRRRPQERLFWNRVFLYVWPPLDLKADELRSIVHRLMPATEGLGLEQVVVRARIPNPATGELRDLVVRISSPVGSGLLITFRPADKLLALKSLSEYDQKVVRVRQRGQVYPYEIIKMITPPREGARSEFPPGDFVEYDLDANRKLAPVDRPYGKNRANIIVGVIRNFTTRYPEGMTRVLLLGDPSRDLGALAEMSAD
jgi:acetyl/propionyl-CoA carboxylase alpha subunit